MNLKISLWFFATCCLAMLMLTGCPSREASGDQSAAAKKPSADNVWTENIDYAFKTAADSGKLVFIDFTGSDWCGWCKLADENIFSTRAWADFADELVCLKVDFPRNGRPDVMTMSKREQLAKDFGVEGFPTLVLASADRKQLTNFSAGHKGASEFIAEVRKAISSLRK